MTDAVSRDRIPLRWSLLRSVLTRLPPLPMSATNRWTTVPYAIPQTCTALVTRYPYWIPYLNRLSVILNMSDQLSLRRFLRLSIHQRSGTDSHVRTM